MLKQEHLLIDGKLVPAASGRVFETINPATEDVLGTAADAGVEDLDAAIGAARRAFDTGTWATDPAFRATCIRQLRDALVEAAEELRATTVAEVGAPVMLTYGAHQEGPVADLGWAADLAESYEWVTDLGESEVMGIKSRRYTRRQPAGVVGAITPWNFPHQINLAKLGPALAAGCTVVLKAAPDTPWCATALGQLIAEKTDIPPGVVNVITSQDHAIGAMLSTDPRVDLVSFTGSTSTGRAVMRSAADTLKKVFLELGGKSAFIALDDDKLGEAMGFAGFSGIVHAGQGCALTTRVLLPRSRFDEGVETLAATLEALGAGDPADPGTVCGPVISARQRDRIEGFLTRAREAGATFVTGGKRADRDKGFFIEPTLVVGVDNTAEIAREEVFGPVLTAIPYDSVDHAVEIANDSDYGLSGAVYGADVQRAQDIAARLRTGTVGVNGGLWYGADVPFGGFKQSGIGREMGVAGFEEYTEIQSVAVPAGS
ncbi:MAG: aldehyde dehydrogenase, Rv0768 family [Frankiales bacterium]|nr:aldehyde dehydrogenase, Rv0768 family [Frankiales bacterium]